MREEFERWFFAGATSKACERNAQGEYKYMPAAQAWKAWNAGAENERVGCGGCAKAKRNGSPITRYGVRPCCADLERELMEHFEIRQEARTVEKKWLETIHSSPHRRVLEMTYDRLVENNPEEYFEFIQVEHKETCLLFTRCKE